MNRILTFAVTLLTTLILTGAGRAAEVRYDADPSVDTKAWHTWAWAKPEPQDGGSPAETRIRRELAAGLAAKGYGQAAREEADFLVDFQAGAQRELRVDRGFGPLGRNARVDTQPVGTLLVDAIDRESGRRAWRGLVSDTLASDPEKADKRTAKAIAKLLKEFPSAEKP